MKIESLSLKNYRGFKDAEISFSDHLTVLVGVNGSGKSSVLDALAMLLSWAVARIRSENGSGRRMAKPDIRNGETSASARLKIQYGESPYEWTLVGWTPGRKTDFRSDWTQLAQFSDVIRERLTAAGKHSLSELLSPFSLPIMVYYPVNRAVLNIPVGVPQKWPSFDPLEAHEGAVSGAADFHSFFEWFRAREDLENERMVRTQERATTEKRSQSIAETLLMPDRDMQVVRGALHSFLPAFNQFEVHRQEEALIAHKDGERVRVDQLSDGEKCLLALVGDLARRLSVANPRVENPLLGHGVVLIDEIDLHLHPAWQRTVCDKLRKMFPNIQFIISTHSPQVLGEVEHEDIRCLYEDPERGQQTFVPDRSFGLDSNTILEEVLGARRRNEEIESQLKSIFDQIAVESFAEARENVAKLESELGTIPGVLKAKTMIEMLEGSSAEHQ